MTKEQLAAAIQAIVNADHSDPFSILGMHEDKAGGGLVVRAFYPGADGMAVVDSETGKQVGLGKRVHDAGFFEAPIKGRKERFAYRLQVTYGDFTTDVDDAYRFPPLVGELDLYLLAEGTHLHSYEKLGAHPAVMEGVSGVYFAVWAPNARRVSVVGDFNNWDGRRHPMRNHPACGVWDVFVPNIGEGTIYKFEIRAQDGRLLPLKMDPYALRCELPPRTAAIVDGLDRYRWNDGQWMETRIDRHHTHAPMSIYEVHLGSWRRVPEDGHRYLTYNEMREQLVPYVRDMGYTHIELMPVNEYPFDGSWGYQPIGLYAPTSRFGTPDEFRALVDACHQNEIGIILDWVPGHFPEDEHGLGLFDGTHLYEHSDPRQGRHMDWGTLIYNYSRSEVQNFLLSNALFWLEQYHIDGLRVDAVASMLYLDYSRKSDQWVPNEYGGNENLAAIAFLRRLNETIYSRVPGAFTAAEESTAWPMVSRPTYLGGLGFGFKWNMGWMHDTLSYISKESIHRAYHMDEVTFGLLYAWHENFILPLSHDEVVHGKGSLMDRMPGDEWQKFANQRVYFSFMYTHPGRKLMFQGIEIGQTWEWNHDTSLGWHLLDYPIHRGLQAFVRDLNHFYKNNRSLYECEDDPKGFQWIDCHDRAQSVISFVRRANDGDDHVVVVCNFTPVVREFYRVGMPTNRPYREAINSDSQVYGGSGVHNSGELRPEDSPSHGQPYSLALTLPPLGAVILKPVDRG